MIEQQLFEFICKGNHISAWSNSLGRSSTAFSDVLM